MGLIEDLWHGALKRGLKEYNEECKIMKIQQLQESYKTILQAQGFFYSPDNSPQMFVYYDWKEGDISWDIQVTMGLFDIQIEVFKDECIEEERKFQYNKPYDIFTFIKLYTTQEPKEEN